MASFQKVVEWREAFATQVLRHMPELSWGEALQMAELSLGSGDVCFAPAHAASLALLDLLFDAPPDAASPTRH